MALTKFRRRLPTPLGFPFPSGRLPLFDELENALPFFPDIVPPLTGWLPAVQIVDGKEELTLTAELPGMKESDIEMTIDDGILTIRGEKTEERKEGDEEKKFLLYERNYGSFQRSFTLPRTVDASKISAEFDKGVLEVHLPKTAEAKIKGQKVEIKSKK
jgi:HSP20 family protein